MAVYLFSGAALLFYLMMLPVRAGLAWRSGGLIRAGFTVGPVRFWARGSLRYKPGMGLVATITQSSSGKNRELRLLRASSSPSSSSMEQALRYLLRHTRLWRLRAHVQLSLSDAAKTALAYGGLVNVFDVLRAVWPQSWMDLRVQVDFRGDRTRADLYGILACRLGHIIGAALIGIRDYLTRRVHTWKSNRSKAL